MIDARFRPLETRIGTPKGGYKRCPFEATWGSTLDDLERELRHLRAKDIVIEVDCELSEIRNDGWPRSNAHIKSPGVRLSFVSSHGPLSYTCATYPNWEHNVRAIALTLDRLRAVDRYGCVKGGEQYKGWAQLPPGGGGSGSIIASEWANLEEAAGFLLRVVRGEPGSPMDRMEVCERADRLHAVFRAAAIKTHPDKPGGSEAQMQKVNRARDYIEKGAG